MINLCFIRVEIKSKHDMIYSLLKGVPFIPAFNNQIDYSANLHVQSIDIRMGLPNIYVQSNVRSNIDVQLSFTI